MKSLSFYLIVAFLTLAIGVAGTWIYQIDYPRFQSKGAWGGTGYVVHDFISSDGGDITLYHEFTSPEQTRYLFQSNSSAAKLIERGSKLNAQGHKVGEKATIVFPFDGKNEVARIFWTDGEDFWFVQASSLKRAKEFENSEIFRSVMSNNSFNRTPR